MMLDFPLTVSSQKKRPSAKMLSITNNLNPNTCSGIADQWE